MSRSLPLLSATKVAHSLRYRSKTMSLPTVLSHQHLDPIAILDQLICQIQQQSVHCIPSLWIHQLTAVKSFIVNYQPASTTEPLPDIQSSDPALVIQHCAQYLTTPGSSDSIMIQQSLLSRLCTLLEIHSSAIDTNSLAAANVAALGAVEVELKKLKQSNAELVREVGNLKGRFDENQANIKNADPSQNCQIAATNKNSNNPPSQEDKLKLNPVKTILPISKFKKCASKNVINPSQALVRFSKRIIAISKNRSHYSFAKKSKVNFSKMLPQIKFKSSTPHRHLLTSIQTGTLLQNYFNFHQFSIHFKPPFFDDYSEDTTERTPTSLTNYLTKNSTTAFDVLCRLYQPKELLLELKLPLSYPLNCFNNKSK